MRKTQTLVTDRLDPHATTTLRQLYKLYGANRLHRALDELVAEDIAQFNKEHRARLARDSREEGKSWGGEAYTLDPETGEKRPVHRDRK